MIQYDTPSSHNSETEETRRNETRSVEFNEHSFEEDDDDEDQGDSTDPELCHSVIFKCIGVTRDPSLQETLRLVA